MIIYLAGGMHSGWQDRVMAAVPDHSYINPAQHGLKPPAQYAFWDMLGIQHADLIFAYIEQDNPLGIGAAFEIGYGLGLGKRVILVDRKSLRDESFQKYAAIIQHAGPIVLETLNDGITMLESIARLAAMVRWSPGDTQKAIDAFTPGAAFGARGEVDCTDPDPESTVGGDQR